MMCAARAELLAARALAFIDYWSLIIILRIFLEKLNKCKYGNMNVISISLSFTYFYYISTLSDQWLIITRTQQVQVTRDSNNGNE